MWCYWGWIFWWHRWQEIGFFWRRRRYVMFWLTEFIDLIFIMNRSHVYRFIWRTIRYRFLIMCWRKWLFLLIWINAMTYNWIVLFFFFNAFSIRITNSSEIVISLRLISVIIIISILFIIIISQCVSLTFTKITAKIINFNIFIIFIVTVIRLLIATRIFFNYRNVKKNLLKFSIIKLLNRRFSFDF